MADPPRASWWTTLPGLLTAIAALLTAVGALIGALSQSGLLARLWPAPPPSPPPQVAPAPGPDRPVAGQGVDLQVREVRRLGDGGLELRILFRNLATAPKLVEPTGLRLSAAGAAAVAPRRSTPVFETVAPGAALTAIVEFPPLAGATTVRLGEGPPVPLPP